MSLILPIIGGVLVIFAGCELFVNSIEWLGRKLRVSENAVGTVLAAIGTALPESLVTLIALVFSGQTAVSQDIGIGAIIGGPLMLATVAYFVVGATMLVGRRGQGRPLRPRIDQRSVSRDVLWFIAIFGLAMGASLIPWGPAKPLVALIIVAAYFGYAFGELGEEVGEQRSLNRLHFQRRLKVPNTAPVVVQVLLGILAMIAGAHVFVDALSAVTATIGLSAVVLSIVLSPIATELPEVMNAVIWVRQRKEDLAVGNVSGSMLVQAAIPCALGLIFTPWTLSLAPAIAVLTIFASVLFLYVSLRSNRLTALRLTMMGVPYVVLIALLFSVVR